MFRCLYMYVFIEAVVCGGMVLWGTHVFVCVFFLFLFLSAVHYGAP